ncbi:MAG TPA: UDP-N-acetylglucosamine 2-epimerase (non-hydrolyzing) [Vicinamibacterales bacterium]|nr:UDP-N-acetylglucosamine 2-epimerase (non-hydrolyzing) [Vicinamibacterales bacterium]
MQLTLVAGARPNFMKVAPLLMAARRAGVTYRLVHTGQHYDADMSDRFFEELELPRPDAHLGVGSGSHAAQTARVMAAFDEEIAQHPADIVVVVGDVNSTLACALVAAKRNIPVAHVEAGLRSGDRRMPEEINRVLTDHLADWLFTTEESAAENLVAEGIPSSRIHFVGNVMIDTLLYHRQRASARPVLGELDLSPRGYALCTLHRPSNVDTPESASNTIAALREIAARITTVVPLHPRSKGRLQEFGLFDQLARIERLIVTGPKGYLDFLALMNQARFVFTDSGGIQEETTALGVPCLTFRENTERPVTLTHGTNQLVGIDPARIAEAVDRLLAGHGPAGRVPHLWDGRAAERILDVLRHVPAGAEGPAQKEAHAAVA